MSFGKRSAGDPHPARQLLPGQPAAAPPAGLLKDNQEPLVVGRMKVANPGGIDKGFIGLAVGVIVVSAGVAIAAPAALDMFTSVPVRPIEQVVAGLDRDHAKAALAREAFPDTEGRAFMEALAKNFPDSQDRLLGKMADIAMNGGDRSALVQVYSQWSMDFVMPNLDAVGRTGADGFDQLVGVVTDAMGAVEHLAGGCDLNAFERLAADPNTLLAAGAYGSDTYKVGMKTGRILVDLVASGQKAPAISAELTTQDQRALTSTFYGMMADPQIASLMQSAMSGASPEAAAASINVCQLARTIVVKLKDLPKDTKSHLMAMAGANASLLASGMRNGALSLPTGAMPGAAFHPAPPSALANVQPMMPPVQPLGGPRVTFSPKLGKALGGH